MIEEASASIGQGYDDHGFDEFDAATVSGTTNPIKELPTLPKPKRDMRETTWGGVVISLRVLADEFRKFEQETGQCVEVRPARKTEEDRWSLGKGFHLGKYEIWGKTNMTPEFLRIQGDDLNTLADIIDADMVRAESYPKFLSDPKWENLKERFPEFNNRETKDASYRVPECKSLRFIEVKEQDGQEALYIDIKSLGELIASWEAHFRSRFLHSHKKNCTHNPFPLNSSVGVAATLLHTAVMPSEENGKLIDKPLPQIQVRIRSQSTDADSV